jgi:hypothetical protein
MADKRGTCWRCTQPGTCTANGFCSIERCDLPPLVSDEQPSNEPGAWTCKVCGFRGFWRGGAHCPAGVGLVDVQTLSRHTPLKG